MPARGSSKQAGDQIVCFSHVQKAGGTTVEAIFRRHFGIRHMQVDPPVGWIYRAEDLAADLRLNPWARSIGSHWLRPFQNFGRFEGRMHWFIVLREPVSRCLSHYQYQVERMGVTAPFEKWAENRIQHNWQTQYLAGEQDLEAAKQILVSRYLAIGLLERFHESLLLIREALVLPALDLTYGRPRNPAGSTETQRILAERYRAIAGELNTLDLELYRFVRDELFPVAVAAYGRERLQQDVQELRDRDSTAPSGRNFRDLCYVAARRAVHLPIQAQRRRAALRAGQPDIRR